MEDEAKIREYKLKNAYTYAIYSGISDKIDYEMKHGSEDEREVLSYMVERYCKEEIICGQYLIEKLEEYNKLAETKYGEKDPELMKRAWDAYEKHKAAVEDWLEGEPQNAWIDDDGNLCIQYDFKYFHYNEKGEWW